MKRLMASLACLAFVVLMAPVASVGAIASLPPEPGTEAFFSALAGISVEDCEVFCEHYSCNMVDEHRASHASPGTDETGDGPHFDCLDFLCGFMGGSAHPECSGLPEPEAELVAQAAELLDSAVENNDTTTIATLVKANPGVFRVNGDRQAVQVVGCGDNVIAHYPLSIITMQDLLGTSD